jgi:hypothetical protein
VPLAISSETAPPGGSGGVSSRHAGSFRLVRNDELLGA